jgi:hypothetical protein
MNWQAVRWGPSCFVQSDQKARPDNEKNGILEPGEDMPVFIRRHRNCFVPTRGSDTSTIVATTISRNAGPREPPNRRCQHKANPEWFWREERTKRRNWRFYLG